MDKKDLRKTGLISRRQILPAEWLKIGESVTAALMSWPAFLRAQTIMVYMAMKDEVPLQNLMEQAWKLGKTVAVPKMTAEFGQMDAVAVDPDSIWTMAAFGIREPLAGKIIVPGDIDIIFLSGVFFDKQGNRLGMGGGYYDRFLARASRAFIVGVTANKQFVAHIPVETHDHPVDAVITEQGFVYSGRDSEFLNS